MVPDSFSSAPNSSMPHPKKSEVTRIDLVDKGLRKKEKPFLTARGMGKCSSDFTRGTGSPSSKQPFGWGQPSLELGSNQRGPAFEARSSRPMETNGFVPGEDRVRSQVSRGR